MTIQLSRGIYFSLDEMFDTRLPILYKYFPEHKKWLDEFVSSGKYHTRLDEDYGPITRIMFEEAYAKRDADILPSCIITPNVQFIAALNVEFNQEVINEPFRKKPSIFINTFPYKLEQWEIADIGSSFVDLIKGDYIVPDVTMFYKDPATFSLDYVDETFSVMFMYEYDKWLEAMSPQFATKLITAVKLVGPALMRNYKSDSPEVQEYIKENKINPLAALIKTAASIITLELQDAEWFSFIGWARAKNEY